MDHNASCAVDSTPHDRLKGKGLARCSPKPGKTEKLPSSGLLPAVGHHKFRILNIAICQVIGIQFSCNSHLNLRLEVTQSSRVNKLDYFSVEVSVA